MARGGRTEVEAAVRSKSRELPSDLRRAQRKFRQWGKRTRRSLKKSFSGIRRDMMGALGIGLGVGMFAAAGREAHEFNKKMLDVRVQAGKTAAEGLELEKAIERVSVATGITKQTLIEGTEAMVNQLGASAATAEGIDALARISVASATDMADLVGVQQLFIKNLGIISQSDMTDAFSSLINVGKEASVPLNEMSTNLIKTSAALSDFGLKGRTGVATLGAMFQAMQPFLGGPEETATGINNLAKSFLQSAGKLKKIGIDVFEPGNKGKLRDPVEIGKLLRDAKVLDDLEVFGSLIKGDRQQKAVKALIKGVDNFARWRKSAMDATDATDDFNEKITSDVGRANQAMARLSIAIGQAFTAERVETFVSALTKVARMTEMIFEGWEQIYKLWKEFGEGRRVAERNYDPIARAAAQFGYGAPKRRLGVQARIVAGTTGAMDWGLAQVLVKRAKDFGIIKGGKINEARAAEIAKRLPYSGDPSDRAPQLVSALTAAQRIVADRGGRDVEVTVKLSRELELEKPQQIRSAP